MITPDQFPLAEAQATFAIANTPLFLLRKLREGKEAQDVSRRMSGEQLLEALHGSVQEAPKTLYEAVRPYVCLVALSLKDEVKFLRESTLIEPSYQDEWFAYARQVLLEMFRPTSHKTIPVPALPQQVVTTRTDAPSNVAVVEPGANRDASVTAGVL